jgi:asparagine synthase (glutamine-hydrolysing)
MCGFVGHVSLDNTAIQKSRLIDSVNILKNRGPDHLGYESGKKFGLAFRRLSIIDLTKNANQPMYSDNKDFICVFNGEIYNYREIFIEIEKDFFWKSRSDTELLLNSWIKWGPKCLEKLDGMFAFAIWDIKKSVLYAARDRMGEKPFYFHINNKNFYFASRPKPIIYYNPEISRGYDTQALRSYLESGYIAGENSIYKSLKKIKAGHYIKFSEEGFHNIPYWKIEDYNTNYSLLNKKEDTIVDELEFLIIKNFKQRFISDVPVGILLSSGIDSSLITAIAKKYINSNENIKTFSVGFSNKIYDESSQSKKIANFLKTDHHEKIIHANDMIKMLPKFFENCDEPFFDSSIFPMMEVASLAKEKVKVVLTGDGGDELFGGYNYYLIIKILSKINYLPSNVKHFLYVMLNSLPIYKLNLLAEALKQNNLIDSFSFIRSIIKKNKHIMSEESLENTISIQEVFRNKVSQFSKIIQPVEACMKLDSIYTLCDDYLQKSDLSTMAFSIEGRSPFLSKEIIEWSATLPTQYKINFLEKKYILRKILTRYLPSDLINRKKIGFEVPIGEWMKNDLYMWTKNIVDNSEYYKNLPIKQIEVQKLFKLLLKGKKGIHPYLWSIIMLLNFNKEKIYNKI